MPSADYSDDHTILDTVALYRRIPPQWVVLDENLGRVRPTSQAFQNSPNGTPMSVALSDVLFELGRTPESLLTGLEGFGLASITAGLARGCGQGIKRDPTPEEPAHALVFGKKTASVKNRFAKECQWVIQPDDQQG
jgi:hypothetical protein